MALTLTQAATISTDDLQRGILEVFVQESVVLDRLPFLTIEGNAYAYNMEKTLPGVGFRNVNEGYAESTGTFEQRTEVLSILGGDADVDRFIAKTRSNLNDQRAAQTRLKVKALSYKFQDHFINGVAANEQTGDNQAVDEPAAWDGIRQRLATLDEQVLTSNVTADITTDEAEMHKLFDELEELVSRVPGINGTNGALYANRKTMTLIKNVGRRLGGVELLVEDMTGKRVVMWQGIPVLDLGDRPTAAHGSHGAPAGSILEDGEVFAVRFGAGEGDGAVTGLTNGGVQVYDLGELQSKPVYRTRIEFYCGLAMFSDKGAAQLKGIGTGAGGGVEG